MRRAFHFFTLTLLFVWPCLHLLASGLGYVNSWKLAGWGMYASNHPKWTGITIAFIHPDFVKTETRLQLTEMAPGIFDQICTPLRIWHVEPESCEELSSKTEWRHLEKALTYAQATPLPKRMKELVDSARELAPEPMSAWGALVLVAEPRLSPWKGKTYVTCQAYFVTDEAVQLGKFGDDNFFRQDLVALMESRLRDVFRTSTSAGR